MINGHAIKSWQIPPTYWPKEMPVYVPLNTTLEEYTRGHNGKITCWFNSTAGTWKGKNYIAFRCQCIPWWATGKIGLGRMSDDWKKPIPPDADWLMLPGQRGYVRAEDPRFVQTQNGLLLVYTTGFQMRMGWFNDDMTVKGSLEFVSTNFALQKQEKNWSVFEHEGQLYAIYMQSPHVVLSIKDNKCEKIHEEPWRFPYAAGTPRGGASPVLHQGSYWHFFHSSSDFDTGDPDPEWTIRRRYHVGVAVFEAKPPFKLLSGSHRPVMSAHDGMPESALPEKEIVGKIVPSRHAAVFPGSAMRNSVNDGWLLTCGVNDQHTFMYDVPDSIVEDSLA